MCRLALFNQQTVKFLGADILAAAFQELTKAMGGSGIGGSVLTKKGYVHTLKGVKLTETELAEWMVGKANREGKFFIFHTRFATTGSVCDGNCHPFTVGGLTMAHNGVASTFAGMGDKTDSEAVARIVSLGYDLSWLEDVSGVWVGFQDGRPFVVKGQSHSSLHLLVSGDMWMFVSQVPNVLKGLFDTDSDLNVYSFIKGVEKHYKTPTYATTKGYSKSFNAYDWEDEYSGRTYYTTPKQTGAAAAQETKPIRAIVPANVADSTVSYLNGVKTEVPKKEVWRTKDNITTKDIMCKAEIVAEHNDGMLDVKITYTSGHTTTIKVSAAVYNSLLAITDPDFLAIKEAVRDSLKADGATYTEMAIEELAAVDFSEADFTEPTDAGKTVSAYIMDNTTDEGRLLVQVRDETGKLTYKEVTWDEYDVLVHDDNANVAKSGFVQPELVEATV